MPPVARPGKSHQFLMHNAGLCHCFYISLALVMRRIEAGVRELFDVLMLALIVLAVLAPAGYANFCQDI